VVKFLNQFGEVELPIVPIAGIGVKIAIITLFSTKGNMEVEEHSIPLNGGAPPPPPPNRNGPNPLGYN
jgi:hypothetical protein